MTQQQLNFDEAEASFYERQNVLNLALHRVEADIYLCRLLERVFYLTHGGQPGETIVKTYGELAARPLWLCCSRSKARSTVGLARHHGLVTVEENRYATGGQKANGYAVDWEGVRRILTGGRGGSQDRPRSEERPRPEGSRQGGPGASSGHPPVLIEHPSASTEQGGASIEHPSLTNLFSISSESLPVPDPDPEAGPGVSWRLPEELAVVPELTEAARCAIPARPVGQLAYGAFAPLQEKHLTAPGSLLDWYARQLSLPDPVLAGGVRAEAILVVAAGLYAARLPPQEVRRSRVAVFCHTVAKGDWRRVLRYIPEAAAHLERLAARPAATAEA